MAYVRWSDGPWYIFWHASQARKKNHELFALWHENHAACSMYPCLTYSEIQKALKIKQLPSSVIIKGVPPWDDTVERCIRSWVKNVDNHYGTRYSN